MAKNEQPSGLNGKKKGLTEKQRVFIKEYLVDQNAARAAKEAGYKNANVVGTMLLNNEKYALVQSELGRLIRIRELKLERKANDILRYIHAVMFFNPLDHFVRTRDGMWTATEEQLKDLPPEIARLIEEMDVVTREKTDAEGNVSERTTTYKIRFVSKAEAMKTAAKHQLSQKINLLVQTAQLDWDKLAQRPVRTKADDLEDRIRGVRMLPPQSKIEERNGHSDSEPH